MLNFQIHSDSDVPASKQLFAQIQFAIASGQYPPAHRLPSTRQLAMITGLHRNTISKVYQQLEESGLVESVAGSGIYVKLHERENIVKSDSPVAASVKAIKDGIDRVLESGCTIEQIRELFLEEINWRISCCDRVIVTVPQRDISAGEIMQLELQNSFPIEIELIELEELPKILEKINFGTLVTNRYFIQEVLAIVPPNSFRVIPIDMYDFNKELEIVKSLPSQACLGVVSHSEGTLSIASSIINSLRGDDLLVLTSSVGDRDRLRAVIRAAHTIIAGYMSYDLVKTEIVAMREDLIRIPDVIRTDSYIGDKSINLLKRELGLKNIK
ncbi:GntR family transcriptional regulator [Pleurocapsales cyanobacterium LEGE 10410]|nr:GntR family transcriptional regulator [Pleurocapsales cyanobacterium LEGE 10410]